VYQSDFTKFMNDYLKSNDEVAQSRMTLRATWWDKPQDLATQQANDASKVSKKAYEYFPLPQTSGSVASKADGAK
jgi:mRNA-degrading endonuclease HigB of HigAB toxin-antitoxin module